MTFEITNKQAKQAAVLSESCPGTSAGEIRLMLVVSGAMRCLPVRCLARDVCLVMRIWRHALWDFGTRLEAQ
jgi:hypothetical protein